MSTAEDAGEKVSKGSLLQPIGSISSCVSDLPSPPVVVHLRAGPATPILKTTKFRIEADASFGAVHRFLRKQLRCQPHDNLVGRRLFHGCYRLIPFL